MTELLQKAFAEIANLPEQEQDMFAYWILEELTSEYHWNELFARSASVLEQLAEEALIEYRADKREDTN